jgi:Cu/Ag efflux protein CusF
VEVIMKRVLSVSLAFIVATCVGAMAALAQKPVERAGDVSKTATITAINHSTRVVTLKDDQGHVEDILCGPEVKRFDELKVGDSVTFTYHAAVVYQVVKAGASGPAASETTSTVAGKGVKPSGAMTRQQTLTVTIEAIDPAAPSVTVRTADGRTISAEVKDKKNLEGVKVGDKVSITFTEAVMIVVEPPKK